MYSMHSPTMRLLTVLELLQSHKAMSGSEIAKRLEVDVRTVRRYILMLQDMGIPVEAERGQYGAYQLQRGHRLPPLMFTDAEAIALTLGLRAIQEFQFPIDATALEGALVKIERVLPEKSLHQVRGIQEGISFYVTPAPSLQHNNLVMVLSSAVQRSKRVWLRYRAWNGEESERLFDPYGIVFNDGFWFTAGFCHLRQDLRTFRLDRVTLLEGREESFERPEDFDALQYVVSSIALMPGTPQLEVLLKTSLEHAQELFPAIMGTLEAAEDGVIFRRAASQLEWIAHYLIMLDFPVKIVQPMELRDLYRQIASRALQIANDEWE